MTSSVLSPTSVVLPSSSVPSTNYTTRFRRPDIKLYLGNYASPDAALDFARSFSDVASNAQPFANNVTFLNGSSTFLHHWANYLENSSQSVNFSVANESATIATQIGAYATSANRQKIGSTNENVELTSILRSLDRIYAIAANNLKVGQRVEYGGTGVEGSTFASLVAANNVSTGSPTQATVINELGFTSLDGLIAASSLAEDVVLSTFMILQKDPFVSNRGVGSELVGLTLRRRSPDGSVAILAARNLAPENEFVITWPRRRPIALSNRTTVIAPADNFTSYSVNLMEMIESDAFVVQFFEIPEYVNRTIDVYFIEHLPGEPLLKLADLTALNASLSLNSSLNSSKLFYTGR